MHNWYRIASEPTEYLFRIYLVNNGMKYPIGGIGDNTVIASSEISAEKLFFRKYPHLIDLKKSGANILIEFAKDETDYKNKREDYLEERKEEKKHNNWWQDDRF
jgi:hypothetical protein